MANKPVDTRSTLDSILEDEARIPLGFGTSGRRGLLLHLSQLEIAIDVLAELEFLQSLPAEEGGITPGDIFYFSHDLRPSSTRLIDQTPQRGELAQALEWAIGRAGMIPCNLGALPTPALAHYALSQGKGCMMVTGSHIPHDRNGYKTYTARGELSKAHEIPIARYVANVRERLYREPAITSPFDRDGQFKSGSRPLSAVHSGAASAYLHRYLDFFGEHALSGLRLLVYQHSAVGRDLLCEILEALGAEVIATGRSETFVPIDTENLDPAKLAALQNGYDQATGNARFDAMISTDGDSDRPLLLAVDPATERLHFINGDLLGILTAEALQADAVVVPISCNDAIDQGNLKDKLCSKTRIGSPYVITGMEQARHQGRQRVCGFEANGGFLTATDIERKGRILKALPTRDAVLPLVAVLSACREHNHSLLEQVARLPQRRSHAALLPDFPRTQGMALIRRLSPANPSICAAQVENGTWIMTDDRGQTRMPSSEEQRRMEDIHHILSEFFSPSQGFGALAAINFLDGLRLRFSNGDVAHIRPSGNADELRIYAVADSLERAMDITARATAQANGILHQLAHWLTDQPS